MSELGHVHDVVDYKYTHLTDAGYPLQKAWMVYERYPSWSITCHGRLVASGGIITPHEGLGEMWFIPGPLAKNHWITTHRIVKDLIEKALPPKIRRLQCLVMEDHLAGHRWVERLGFIRDCTMRKYGPAGENVVMYSQFPGER